MLTIPPCLFLLNTVYTEYTLLYKVILKGIVKKVIQLKITYS